MSETVIIIDFETTGLSPAQGARATEVAAVRLVGNEIVDTFQSLMNSGSRVPPEIERITGISNAMVRGAPPAAWVMQQLLQFVGTAPLVAHNANFDSAFFAAECQHARLSAATDFACTMKLAKRVYPLAPNYKLQTLLDYADIDYSGRFHRALADSVATSHLWLQMHSDLCAKYQVPSLKYRQLKTLSATSAAQVASKIESWKKKTN
jgi:DNA polymerase-3 subunit epsilon